MELFLQILNTVLPFLYAALVWVFAELFFRAGSSERPNKVKRWLPLVFATLTLHALYIGGYTINTGHCLLATIWELSSLIAFTLLSIYAFVELRVTREASGTGFLVTLVAFIFQTASSLFISTVSTLEGALILKDPIFNVHVTTAVFGYAALTLASIYGALYLLLFRAITRNQFGAVYQHLPSLERLERYGIRSTSIGFVFLTISIALGWVLMQHYPISPSVGGFILDPKILATLLVWAVFGITLVVRKIARVEGRKLVLFWMSGFALTVISMTIVNALGTTFHNFN